MKVFTNDGELSKQLLNSGHQIDEFCQEDLTMLGINGRYVFLYKGGIFSDYSNIKTVGELQEIHEKNI